jgi:DNA-binding transcriptional regulator YdaS (Cro superfamily)
MTKPTSPDVQTGIDKAIQKAGSQVKLATAIGAKQQMVSYWKNTGFVSDAGMCAAIEQVTGVPCEELNPNEDWVTLRAVLCAPARITGGKNRKSTKEARMVA